MEQIYLTNPDFSTGELVVQGQAYYRSEADEHLSFRNPFLP